MTPRQAIITAAALTAICFMGCVTPAQAAVSCSFSAASGVNFGNYDVLSGTPTLSNGTLTYVCTGYGAGGGLVTIFLNRGNAPTFNPRFMLNGAQHLNYNLYLDAALTMIWGNGNGGTSIYGPTLAFNSTPATVTIFSRIPAGQDVTAGGYLDTIRATINF